MIDSIVPVANTGYSCYIINVEDYVETKVVTEEKAASNQFILSSLAEFLETAIKDIADARRETHKNLSIFSQG